MNFNQINKILLSMSLTIFSNIALSQKIPEEEKQILIPTGDDDPALVTTPYQDKALLQKLKKKYCPQYSGKYISYYGNVYFVDACKRRLIEDNDLQFQLTKTKVKIHPVEAEVIIALPEGETKERLTSQKPKTCQSLARQYITYSDVDVYWVEGCKKRRFPDWDSYFEHKAQNFKSKEPLITSLTWPEFIAIEDGKDMPSVLKIRPEEQQYQAQIDIIPIDEACKGLNGKIVSFYSKIYKIEGCKKRSIDPEKYLYENRGKRLNIMELSSEQWVSLPDGRPL